MVLEIPMVIEELEGGRRALAGWREIVRGSEDRDVCFDLLFSVQILIQILKCRSFIFILFILFILSRRNFIIRKKSKIIIDSYSIFNTKQIGYFY